MPTVRELFANSPPPSLVESLEAERDELRTAQSRIAERLASVEAQLAIERIGETGDSDDLFTSSDDVDHADA